MKKIISFSMFALLLTASATAQSSNGQADSAEPEMVFVQGGTFWMGCSNEQHDDCESDDENPLHSVTVSSFQIGKYEVTQAQWKSIMGTTVGQQRDTTDATYLLRGEGDNYPMYYVNWDEIQEFICRLNVATGKQYRLPTEAEWEFAARGGMQSKSYKYSGSHDLDNVGWFADNSGSTTHVVGGKSANELGIYDMSGNVWEWCNDRKGAYHSSAQQDPTGAVSGSYLVLRGGSWSYLAPSCRVANRYIGTSGYRSDTVGFRVVVAP